MILRRWSDTAKRCAIWVDIFLGAVVTAAFVAGCACVLAVFG